MQKDSRFFDDFAKLASGAAGTIADMKREMEAIAAAKIEKLLLKMNVVRREEFETVRLMAEQARLKQEEILEKLAKLEKLLETLNTGEKSPGKPAKK